jgi:hypothetical protein
MKPGCVSRGQLQSASVRTSELTSILLPEDLCEVDSVLNRISPRLGLESERRHSFGNGRELEEVASDDELGVVEVSETSEGEGDESWSHLNASKGTVGSDFLLERRTDSSELVEEDAVDHGDCRRRETRSTSALQRRAALPTHPHR